MKKLDRNLLQLCAEYHAIEEFLVDSRGTPITDETHHSHALWEAACGRRASLFRRIANLKAHTWEGVAAKASILPYQVEATAALPGDDRVELFAAGLARDACALAGSADGERAIRNIETVAEHVKGGSPRRRTAYRTLVGEAA